MKKLFKIHQMVWSRIRNVNKQLLARVMEIQPRLHLFGHIHAQHGVTAEHGITFSNGAVMSDDYTNLQSPLILEFST